MRLYEIVNTGSLSGAEIPKRYLTGIIKRKICLNCGFDLTGRKRKEKKLKFCPDCGELIKWRP